MRIGKSLALLAAIIFSQSLIAKEIVVGVEHITKSNFAILLTPVVIPDLISAKLALEYKLHTHLNLVVPLEAKWMDYRAAIRLGASMFTSDYMNYPQEWYAPDNQLRVLLNIDFSQAKLSTGLGVKYFPFSESMTTAFFMKTLLMLGVERFYSYEEEARKDSAIVTHVLSLGYNWVLGRTFICALELGEETMWHSNPVKNLPFPAFGLMPFMQFNLGFTI